MGRYILIGFLGLLAFVLINGNLKFGFDDGSLSIRFSTSPGGGLDGDFGYYRPLKDDSYLVFQIDPQPGKMFVRMQPIIIQHVIETDGWKTVQEQPKDTEPKIIYGGFINDRSGRYELNENDMEKLRNLWRLEVGTSIELNDIGADGSKTPFQYTVIRTEAIQLEGLDEPVETFVIEAKAATVNAAAPADQPTPDTDNDATQETSQPDEAASDESAGGLTMSNTAEELEQMSREFSRFLAPQATYSWYAPKIGTVVGFNFGESDKPFYILKGAGQSKEIQALFVGQRLASRYEKPRAYKTIRSPAKRLEAVNELRALSKTFHDDFADTQNFKVIQSLEDYEFFSLETLNAKAEAADMAVKEACESILSDLSALDPSPSPDAPSTRASLKIKTSIQADFIDFGCAKFAGADLTARIQKEFDTNKDLVNMPFLGGIFRELNNYNRKYYKVKPLKPIQGEETERQGLILTKVTESGVYFRDENLVEGDIVGWTNGAPVSSMDDFNAALIDWVATEEDSLSISFLGVDMSYLKNIKREMLQ